MKKVFIITLSIAGALVFLSASARYAVVGTRGLQPSNSSFGSKAINSDIKSGEVVKVDNLEIANNLWVRGSGEFGPRSVTIGSSVNGDYIQSTGSFLRFILGGGGAANERIRMTGDGKLGIGTKVPAKALDVNGGVQANEICLPNGVISGKIKCFVAVCPGANGQWTLSETATCPSTTKLNITASTLGIISQRVRATVDDISLITFSAQSGDVTVNSIKLKFQGLALASSTTVVAKLIDPNTGTVWGDQASASCVADTVSNSCTVTFNYTNKPVVTNGASKAIKLRVDSTLFNNTANTSDSLTVAIQNASDVNYNNNQTLDPALMPLSITTLGYE